MVWRARLPAILVAILVLAVGVGLAVTGGVFVDGTITLDAEDGPTVELTTTDSQLQLEEPIPDSNTVEIVHDDGTVVFESGGGTSAAIDSGDITGTHTAATGIDATSWELTIDPEDKPAVVVGGNIDSIEFREAAVGDATTDFSYSASGESIVTIQTDASSTTLIAVADDGSVLDSGSSDSSGEVTFTSLPDGTHDVQINEASDPIVDDDSASPSGGETVSETPVTLGIDVDDPDFDQEHGDEVTVTFYDGGGQLIGTDTLTSARTASTTWEDPNAGPNDWYVVAKDDYGNEVTSQTFTFKTPDTLEIRDETDPDELVTTDAEVEVTFFAGQQVIERSTDDGTIDMEGLPANEEFVVQVNAEGYVTRQAVIRSITKQQEIFLLPDDVDSVQTRFVLDDATGQFDEQTTRVFVRKPITRDNETVYRTVVADEFGTGGYSTVLERDQRYLLEIEEMQTGEIRTLGPYVATTSEEVRLQVDSLSFEVRDDGLGYQWGSQYLNETDPAVQFNWAAMDTLELEQLHVRIYQAGDEKTVILDETFVDTQTISQTAVIPSDIEDPETRTWSVEWEASVVTEEDGEMTQDTIRGSTVVGPSQLPIDLPGVSDDVLSIISVFLILMVAGLFSAANVMVGGIVTSLFAGGLWFVGVLPDEVTGMLIALGLLVSIIWHVKAGAGQVRP